MTSATADTTVTVHILGKDYKLSCPPDERDGLLQAARLVDERMKDIKGGGVIGLERVAVLAALKLGFELLQTREQSRQDSAASTRIDRLLGQLEEEIAAVEQVQERLRQG